MTRTFIQTHEFTKEWERLGLNDDDLRRLELDIMLRPELSRRMSGTGGLRKLRFAYENRGKSGSTRVCFVDFVFKEAVYLITVYGKNEKDNLSQAERNNIRKMVAELEKSL